jgi:hypothetical protein
MRIAEHLLLLAALLGAAGVVSGAGEAEPLLLEYFELLEMHGPQGSGHLTEHPVKMHTAIVTQWLEQATFAPSDKTGRVKAILRFRKGAASEFQAILKAQPHPPRNGFVALSIGESRLAKLSPRQALPGDIRAEITVQDAQLLLSLLSESNKGDTSNHAPEGKQ